MRWSVEKRTIPTKLPAMVLSELKLMSKRELPRVCLSSVLIRDKLRTIPILRQSYRYQRLC